MKQKRWISVLAILVVFIVGSWLWWVRPVRVDMATYAPANSLVYLEANRPLEVVEAITGTAAWKVVEQIQGNPSIPRRNHWLQRFVGWTGIGPIQSVILARAQLAVVVTDLGTTEEGDTLRIKPEAALVIETHTAERRIRPIIEQALKRLAEITYGQPVSRRTTIDGVEFIAWASPDGSRQIVATILGSLVIVGNSEHSVQNCLAVCLRRAPSLKDDAELHRMRLQLAADRSLTFGYVPPGNSARLLAVGLPLIIGRAPGDSEFQRLTTTGAAKIFGSLGWSSHPFMNGIEDRYLISLQPSIVARLKPDFARNQSKSQIPKFLPDQVDSITYYKFENPAAVWQDLKTSVSSQIDALSAIVFSSLLKAALLPYGISEPEKFLGEVNGQLLTFRFDHGDRSILMAGVRNQSSLRDLVTKDMGINARSERLGEAETLEDGSGEIGAAFINGFVLMGSPIDVRRCVENARIKVTTVSDEQLRRITFFVPLSSSANIITYTNDGDRILSFVSAIIAAKRELPVPSDRIEQMIAGLPYSATETTLGERGLERITRSSLGQFSTLLPLIIPEHPKLGKSANHINEPAHHDYQSSFRIVSSHQQ